MMSRIVSSAKMEESFSSSSNIHILQHGNFPDFWLKIHQNYLVGGFNPSEKYARQVGTSCPQGSGENKKCLKPPPVICISWLIEIPNDVIHQTLPENLLPASPLSKIITLGKYGCFRN